MVSPDGVTWSEAADLGEELEVQELACSAERIAIVSGTEAAAIRSCDARTCSKPIAFHRSDSAVVAPRVAGAQVALWLGARYSQTHLRNGERAELAVYRVEGGKLVLDRVHIAATSGKLPVVRDKQGFFALMPR